MGYEHTYSTICFSLLLTRMFPTPTSLIARIDAVIRDITIYELDPEKKGEHLAHLDQYVLS